MLYRLYLELLQYNKEIFNIVSKNFALYLQLHTKNTYMIPFKDISVADKETVLRYTLMSNRRNCDLSFSNLCSWSSYYHTQFAVWNNCLIFKFWTDEELAYMMPVGEGDLRTTIKEMIDDAQKENQPFRMLGVCSDMREALENLYHNDFDFVYDRDYDDYLYQHSDLSTLAGKKFQPKRNHINRFKKTYQYNYLPLTTEHVDECLALEERWYDEKDDTDESILHERNALTFALRHFNEIGLTGGILEVEGKIAAFTFGMPINFNTFGVHVEKANTNIEGSYAMINYEFANHIPDQYIYINREEDLGKEGLRKSKLSYQPVLLLKKFMARLKEQPATEMVNW